MNGRIAGNRTWLLHDFDRYVLECWRPNGVQVIFGDAHVEKKQRTGFHLCDYCGMIEQQRAQFPVYQNQRFVQQCGPQLTASLQLLLGELLRRPAGSAAMSGEWAVRDQSRQTSTPE